MEFLDKKVIVTGANRSIGRAMALAFAERGADVVISYRSDQAGAEETVAKIKATGRHACAFYADFSDMTQVAEFADKAIGHLGHVDLLVNNAAMLTRQTLLELDPQIMQKVFQVNTTAPLYLAQLCARHMIEQEIEGCILNISSISATTTFPNGVIYAASKAAMNKWTQNAALDLAQHKIRVNAIAPGVVESGMNQDTKTNQPERWHALLKDIPLQRMGTPNDIANMAIFLASAKADWITGKIIEVDGGYVL